MRWSPQSVWTKRLHCPCAIGWTKNEGCRLAQPETSILSTTTTCSSRSPRSPTRARRTWWPRRGSASLSSTSRPPITPLPWRQPSGIKPPETTLLRPVMYCSRLSTVPHDVKGEQYRGKSHCFLAASLLVAEASLKRTEVGSTVGVRDDDLPVD